MFLLAEMKPRRISSQSAQQIGQAVVVIAARGSSAGTTPAMAGAFQYILKLSGWLSGALLHGARRRLGPSPISQAALRRPSPRAP
jgi:hypothetical protein